MTETTKNRKNLIIIVVARECVSNYLSRIITRRWRCYFTTTTVEKRLWNGVKKRRVGSTTATRISTYTFVNDNNNDYAETARPSRVAFNPSSCDIPTSLHGYFDRRRSIFLIICNSIYLHLSRRCTKSNPGTQCVLIYHRLFVSGVPAYTHIYIITHTNPRSRSCVMRSWKSNDVIATIWNKLWHFSGVKGFIWFALALCCAIRGNVGTCETGIFYTLKTRGTKRNRERERRGVYGKRWTHIVHCICGFARRWAGSAGIARPRYFIYLLQQSNGLKACASRFITNLIAS